MSRQRVVCYIETKPQRTPVRGSGGPPQGITCTQETHSSLLLDGHFFCILYFFFFFYRKVEPINCKPGKNKQGDILGLDHGSFWKTCSQLWALPEEGCDIKGRDSRQFSQGSECVLEGATSDFQLQVAFLSTPRHSSHLWGTDANVPQTSDPPTAGQG